MAVSCSDRLRRKFRAARNVVVCTGAGMSAESGVPTYRGSEGIWKKFRPEQLASFDAFLSSPDLVWEWYRHRREIISSIEPNAGHIALAEMERSIEHVVIVTQNIDNLHRRAGSTRIHELHGNIERNYCIECGEFVTAQDVASSSAVPRCRHCGGLIRPDVVWFGEQLPEAAWTGAIEAVSTAEILLSVGTSGVVYPAASIPDIARRAGAYTVEINIEPTELSGSFNEVIRGTAGEALPMLLQVRTHSDQEK